MQFHDFSPFASSFSSIVVSEIGDKTFFITAILCMTYSMGQVFIGSYLAMVLMTLLSCFFGYLLPQLINPFITHFITIALFLFFGQKLIRGFWQSKDEGEGEDEEEVEAQLEVEKIKKKLNRSDTKKISSFRVIQETAILTFFAEWGDRSQITTISLATDEAYLVLIGALLGHFLCTGIAVLGGKIISQKLSEKWINLVGGILFVIFGINKIIGLQG